MAFIDKSILDGQTPFNGIVNCSKCTNGNKVTIEFSDTTFTFHAQWLYDTRCDKGSSRNAQTAFCQLPSTARAQSVSFTGNGIHTILQVDWTSKERSEFPAPWLRVMAPLVAEIQSPAAQGTSPRLGWLVDTLKIPEISYHEMANLGPDALDTFRLQVMDSLLDKAALGILKVVDLPAPDIEQEQTRDHKNNIVTRILKQIFGSTWAHPIRGADTTFNVSSHSDDANRAELPNYDVKQILLPHSDHAFYEQPIQVIGFYGLEGKSENTWVSSLAALQTFNAENPHLSKYLSTASMAVGRVSRFYGIPLYQATLDTAVTMHPGSSDEIKRLRWHPNLTSSLLVPYSDFRMAREAHQKLQEIIRRDAHQLKLVLNPGDLYIWNNFTLLHGRERVLEVPRTGTGQTVSEQAIADKYRELQVKNLAEHIDEKWLVHLPAAQLRELANFISRSSGPSNPISSRVDAAQW